MEATRNTVGSSLQISTEVIEKIARLAAMEVDGVVGVSSGNFVNSLLGRLAPQGPVVVEIKDQVADITINLVVKYGSKIRDISEKVQQNVKTSVQSMTQITVAKVNIVITGVTAEEPVIAAVDPITGEEYEQT